MKRQPDFLLILMVVFGLGVAISIALPMMSNDTVAAPASALQAGVIAPD